MNEAPIPSEVLQNLPAVVAPVINDYLSDVRRIVMTVGLYGELYIVAHVLQAELGKPM